MSKNKVLCLTHAQDTYVPELMSTCLKDVGLDMVRMNTDSFPLNIEISVIQNNNDTTGKIRISDKVYDLSEFSAVWFRKNNQSNLQSSLDEKLIKQATKEATITKNYILYSLESLFWFDSPYNIQRGENKHLQLNLARKAGLKIPNSLLSNSPNDARDFYNTENGNIITKMVTAFSTFMSSAKAFVYTSKVKPEHLKELHSLKYCPMQFQQEIEKAYELRVIYVDGECFTGKIASSATIDVNKPDWRKAGKQDFRWEVYQLPSQESDKINVLMKSLFLKFGALDLIRSTNNEYVFLEVNPCGEWGMLQKELNLPIAQKIAKSIKNNIEKGTSNESE